MTFALVCWSIGDLLWAVWLDNLASPPFPSAADLAYLLMYPAMYVSLMLLIRFALTLPRSQPVETRRGCSLMRVSTERMRNRGASG